MADPVNVDGRPVQGGASLPVTVMNPIAVTIGGVVEIANDSGNPVPVTPPASTTANTPSIASSGTAIASNSSRKAWALQNLGTNPLFVRLGASASTSVFHLILKPGTANDDGKGGYISDEMWKGEVSIAGTSPRYTATELT